MQITIEVPTAEAALQAVQQLPQEEIERFKTMLTTLSVETAEQEQEAWRAASMQSAARFIAPPSLASGNTVAVQVTVLEEVAIPDSSRGQRMAVALEKLAQSPTFAGIDGEQWQREVRVDRQMPGRGE